MNDTPATSEPKTSLGSLHDLAEAIGPEPVAEPEPERERVLLHMPVDVRSLSLAMLAGLAVLYTLQWASVVLIPLMLGVTVSYALSPLVDRLERARLPRAAAAALLLLSIMGGIGSTVYSLSDDASALIESLPEVAQKIRQTVRASQSPSESTMDKMQKAATQLEQAA
ncbi:MAG: AI-2E family transporter, partial [Burkholderiaceae bacterium]|nr:AI-2E family transporter [Burkholderiaceae bacterium]